MKKIEDFQKKIDKIKEKTKSTTGGKNSSAVVDIAAELVAGVLVGVMIGLMFDNLFDLKPLFLIICMILAITATFRSIWKKYIK